METVVATGLRCAGWFVAGCILIVLGYQVPARLSVTIGNNDGGYVQGFNDAENRWGTTTDPAGPAPFRWTKADSDLLFPQIGQPVLLSIHARAPMNPSSHVRLLLNGATALGTIPMTGQWTTQTFTLAGGLSKPDDLFVTIHSDAARAVNNRVLGVQIDRIELRTAAWPIIPAPGQVLQGGIAAALAAALLRRRSHLGVLAVCGMVGWLVFYRLAAGGYPIRHLLRWMITALAAALAVRHVEQLARLVTRRRALVAAVGCTVVWLVLVLGSAQAHTVLATPGVEKDFRVFASRSTQLVCPPRVALADAPCVLRADGFYQLGYPLLVWLVRPVVHDNPFLAARWVGLGSGAVLLLGTYLIGLRLFGPAGGLLALAIAALDALTVQYSLLLGTDMAFAAAWIVALAAMVSLDRDSPMWAWLGAGLLCGLAFAIRHPGILALPAGWALALALWHVQLRDRRLWHCIGWLTLGFVVTALPQLVINTVQTGQPLYSQQAKNIWLAVYGNTDWSRWSEAANDVKLLDLLRQEPARFAANWAHNILLFFGTGAADPTEFGQAAILRLLGFPANVLAVLGLLAWARQRRLRPGLLLATALTYVVAISVGFSLIRFFLPLIGLWAVAAASTLIPGPRAPGGMPHRLAWSLALPLLVLGLLTGQMAVGATAVVALQPQADVAMVAAIEHDVPAGTGIEPRLAADDTIAKYSAVAHRFTTAAARYILWSTRSAKAQPAGVPLATAGPYRLYRLATP